MPGVVKYTEISRKGGRDESGHRTYERAFLVETDTKAVGPIQVAAAVPIPWGMYYDCGGGEVDFLARCKRQEAAQILSQPYLWNYTVGYDSKPYGTGQTALTGGSGGTIPTPSQPQNQADTQPDLRTWLLKKSTRKIQMALTRDYAATDVLASNRQPFDPPVMKTVSIPVLTITAYKDAAWDVLGKSVFYNDSVNDAAYLGFAANKVKCTDYTYDLIFEHNAYYWKIDVVLELATDRIIDWDTRVLDAGTYERQSAVKPNEPILDAMGNPVQSPYPLNGAGLKLPFSSAFVYKLFKDCIPRNFSGLI